MISGHQRTLSHTLHDIRQLNDTLSHTLHDIRALKDTLSHTLHDIRTLKDTISHPPWYQCTKGHSIPHPPWYQDTKGHPIPHPPWYQDTKGHYSITSTLSASLLSLLLVCSWCYPNMWFCYLPLNTESMDFWYNRFSPYGAMSIMFFCIFTPVYWFLKCKAYCTEIDTVLYKAHV